MSSMKRTHVILALGAVWLWFGVATQVADVAVTQGDRQPQCQRVQISTDDLAVFLGMKTTVADSQVAPVLAGGHAKTS